MHYTTTATPLLYMYYTLVIGLSVISAASSEDSFIEWAAQAHAYIQTLDCHQVGFISSLAECQLVRRMARGEMAVHIAPPHPDGRFQVVLPERTWVNRGDHDAVLVLDPYPAHLFGHLVVVFYLDRGLTGVQCELKGGNMLENNYCLHLASKRRCRHAFHESVHADNVHRFCEVHFLPVVNFRHLDIGKAAQYLQCREDIPDFAPCPLRRNVTDFVIPANCDPLRTNNPSCRPPLASIATPLLPSPCLQMDIRCDQAVLVAGGWRPEGDAARAETNVRILYYRLRQTGFQISNIHSFLTDGQHWLRESLPNNFHPSARMKVALRHHLQTLCSTEFCTNTLLVYLNNPTRLDGTMLLWDANHDGKVSSDEKYSIDELVQDLSRCRARKLVLLVEQNFAGDLHRALQDRKHHFENTVMISSTNRYEFSRGGAFTEALVEADLKRTCIETLTNNLRLSHNASMPVGAFTGREVTPSTIFGAPCDTLADEDNMAGCLALPTSVWLRNFMRSGRRT